MVVNQRLNVRYEVQDYMHYPVAAEIVDVCIIEGHHRILARLVVFAGLRTSSLLVVMMALRAAA
jgi:hypothetical protein